MLATEPSLRGDAKWSFKDAYSGKDAYAIAGRYTRQGEKIAVSVKVFYNGEEVHHFELRPQDASAKQIAREVRNNLRRYLKKSNGV
jgi:hypothetical protein